MLPLVTFRVRNNVDLRKPITLKKRVADLSQASGYRVEPIDLTGATLIMQVRDERENLLATFTTTDNTILIVDALLGKIQFQVARSFMLQIAQGQWLQDLVMQRNGENVGLWRGLFEVTDGQTRP